MISIFQLIFLVIAILFLTSVIVQLQRDKMSTGQAVLWGVIWICLIIATFFAQYLSVVSRLIGITRPIDVVVYTSIIFLFIYMYHIQLAQVKLSREITEMVRKDAVRKMKK